jgi:hypothetical protein
MLTLWDVLLALVLFAAYRLVFRYWDFVRFTLSGSPSGLILYGSAIGAAQLKSYEAQVILASLGVGLSYLADFGMRRYFAFDHKVSAGWKRHLWRFSVYSVGAVALDLFLVHDLSVAYPDVPYGYVQAAVGVCVLWPLNYFALKLWVFTHETPVPVSS